MDNIQSTNEGLRELALFAGAGGGILGGHLLGWRTVCGVEWDAYAASVLLARQNDGVIPPFPIWDDVQTFDGKPWRGLVDVVSGGFPCQPHSMSGNREGTQDSRWLWDSIKRIIADCEPGIVWLENVPGIYTNGAAWIIQEALSEMGFSQEWGCLSSASCGGEHVRERVWVLAYTDSAQLKRRGIPSRTHKKYANLSYTRRGKDKPGLGRTSNGIPAQMDRLKCIGNAQDPFTMATAFTILQSRIEGTA